ncbi:MAG: PAS domain S-box protein [Dehalococcoidia bacterium]
MDKARVAILVVDDEESIRKVLSRRLEAEGYCCVTAANGKEAMEAASKQHFDLVLTDIKMPVMSGMEVLSQMAVDHPDTCVLMVTAMTDRQTAVEAMSLGAYDYVTKPFNLDDVATRVERALERRRLLSENRDLKLGNTGQAQGDPEGEFRRLVESTGDGYLVIQESRIVFANAKCAQMLEYAAEELAGRPVQEIMTAEALKELSKVHKKRLGRDAVPQRYETVMVKKDGTPCPVDFGAGLMDYAGSAAVGVVLRDVTEHRRAEEQFRLVEEKFRTIFENSAVAITVTDENENIVSWNKFTEFLLGMDEDDMHMKPVSSLYPEEEWAKIRAQNIRKKGMQHHLETKIIRKNREVIDVDLSVSVFKRPDGRIAGSIGIIADITDRKWAQGQLQLAEESFNTIFENSAVAITVADENENIISWNKFTEFLLGMDKDDLCMKPVSSLYPEEEWTKIRAQNIRKKGMQHHLETKVVRKDQEIIDVDLSVSVFNGPDGTITGSVGMMADITARKRVQDRLHLAEENYRTIFENSAVAITVTDENENIVSWNKFTEFLLGMGKDDLCMKPVSSLYPEEEWTKIRAQNIRQKGMQHHLETKIVRSNQDIIDVDLSVSVFKGPDGKVIGSIGVLKDITECKKAEQEKFKTEQQLQIAGRLAAVGELAAGVAHELNNPLSAVQAFAQFLSSNADLDESIKSDIDTIYKEAQRASRITSNLLSFARMYRPERSPISMNQVIEDSLELYAYRMRVNNIEVTIDLDAGLPKTIADFHQMQQVFVNILTNAEQAMSEAHGEGKLVVASQKAGDTIRVSFADDGPGILEENLERMFDPFFTTKEVGKGTGLGLSICRGILQDHGGQIRAISKLGEGTTFVVEIPVVSENPALADEAGPVGAEIT